MGDKLDRFTEAQQKTYDVALSEIKSGRKMSHWMWYIFPQFAGLGLSETSKFYAIKNLQEARDYLSHPVLGTRLKEISGELLKLKQKNAYKIFGNPDDSKLKSCMTLFSVIDESEDKVFHRVIEEYFEGRFDEKTFELIRELLGGE